jgi:hypothetical protein
MPRPGHDEPDDNDPIETLRAFLEPKLRPASMDRVHALLDAMADQRAGRVQTADRRRGARDAAVMSGAMDSALERFPGMSRIRVG